MTLSDTVEHEMVFDGDHLRAVLHPGPLRGARKQLMVTFDFRQNGKNDFTPIRHATHFARMKFPQLSIKSQLNDWFINADTAAMEQALAPLAARYEKVHLLGYSMGGYGALRFARVLGARAAVLISPQVSIDPAVVPFDSRYLAESAGFDPLLGDLSRHAQTEMAGLMLVDPFSVGDIAHARMIQALHPRMEIVRLPFGGHPASLVLRDTRMGWVVNHAAADKTPRAGVIRDAHRQGRKTTPGYWLRMALYSAENRPDLSRFARTQYAALKAKAENDAQSADTP